MVQYLAKRIGRSLLTLFIIVTLVFCLLRTRCRCRSAASGKTPCTVTWA